MREPKTLPRRAPLRAALALLTALLLVAVFAVPLATVPVAAAQANATVDETLRILDVLQGGDISPEWQPDIQANEALVASLLQAYSACGPSQRRTFTEAQKEGLAAYFRALYTLQGENPDDVDALFSGETSTGAETSTPVSSASSSSFSSSRPASSASPPPASNSLPASASTPAPISSSPAVAQPSTSVSMPALAIPPQPPGGNALADLLGNRSLGTILIVLLAGLAALVFLRFLAALRSAGRAPQAARATHLRQRELFGENYDPGLHGSPAEDAALDTLPPGEAYRPQAGGVLTGAQQADDGFDESGLARQPDNPWDARINEPELPMPSLKPPAPPPPPLAEEDERPATAPPGAYGPARTGRPKKMAFRQGSPEDLDAIDD